MLRKIACAGLVCFSVLSLSPALAGGDDVEPGLEDPADGPPFFGDALDIKSRKTLVDALVRAEFGKGQVILTRTDPEGKFRFGAFGRTVDPNSIEISCAMKGYKAVDIVRTPGRRDEDPIEVQCLLEPE
ncbi:MAG: hypothetical protein JWN07_897 [Hyphomicrobiales bacterium]|nr:hypothetical protein [Hyphomicrobiales bacterium]